jgi:hypothetical protein
MGPTEMETLHRSKLSNFIDTGPTDYGDWTKARSNAYFYKKNGGTNYYMNGTTDGDPNFSATAVDDPYNTSPVDIGYEGFAGRFMQNQSLVFPTFDYDDYKEIALRRGEYYTTNVDGDVFRDGFQVNPYDAIFSMGVNDDNRWVFIDTINQQPPADDLSNLATISLSGKSPHFKGLLYLAANLDTAGMGNPPSIIGYDPDGAARTIKKVFINGLCYSAGNWESTGNPVIYGSMVMQHEVTGRGTPEVWYNSRLKHGLVFPVGNRVHIALFKVE